MPTGNCLPTSEREASRGCLEFFQLDHRRLESVNAPHKGETKKVAAAFRVAPRLRAEIKVISGHAGDLVLGDHLHGGFGRRQRRERRDRAICVLGIRTPQMGRETARGQW